MPDNSTEPDLDICRTFHKRQKAMVMRETVECGVEEAAATMDKVPQTFWTVGSTFSSLLGRLHSSTFHPLLWIHDFELSYSILGPRANRENRSSPPPASSSRFKNLFGPNSKAFSPSTSSPSSSFPLFRGPLRPPSNSQRLFFPDFTKAT